MKIEKSIYAWPKNIQGEEIQTLLQFIDINDALHFELIWTGDEWIDCPGELFEQALIRGMPGVENWTTAPKESFVDLFFPGALEPRFNVEQQKEIKKFLKLDIEDRVLEIATHIHAEQLDLANRPLINHILRTMENATMMPSVEQMPLEDKINLYLGAVLHRTLDHPGSSLWPKVLPSDLAEWGIPRDVLAIVECLTKDYSLIKYLGQERDQDSYLTSVAENPLARLVKIAQVADEDANRQRILWMRRIGVSPPAGSDDSVATTLAMNLSEEELDFFMERATSAIDPIMAEELLNDFQPKFEQLLASFSKGDADEVAAEIERLYRTYVTFGGFSGLHVNVAFRETFNEFLLASSRYLESTGKTDVLQKILEDFPDGYTSFTKTLAEQQADTNWQLGMIKINHFGPKHPIGVPPREEFFPEFVIKFNDDSEASFDSFSGVTVPHKSRIEGSQAAQLKALLWRLPTGSRYYFKKYKVSIAVDTKDALFVRMFAEDNFVALKFIWDAPEVPYRT
jgi:hypothetical protein